jgi:predicted metal-dependent hydrolase
MVHGSVIKDAIATMAHDHRTLQQTFTMLCLAWLRHLASLTDRDYDLRNEASVLLAKEIVERRLTREDTRRPGKYIKGKTKKLKYYVYNFVPEDTDKFRLRLEFKKQTVTKQEIIKVLEEIIEQLREKDEAPTLKG